MFSKLSLRARASLFLARRSWFFCLKCESSNPLFRKKNVKIYFFFTKNFPQYLPPDTWIAVSTNLLPKVCHQETGNDLKKKYQKDELRSKSTSGHVECSFLNPSRNFSPKGVGFLAQTPRSVLNYIGFKKNHFSSNVPLDTEVTLFRTLPFFLQNAEKCYLKIRGRFLYFFLSKRLSFLKISSGHLIRIIESTAD